MNDLEMVGWKPGLKTVSLIQAIKSHTGVSLFYAKQLVEQLTVGQAVKLSFTSSEVRDRFRGIAEELGAICR